MVDQVGKWVPIPEDVSLLPVLRNLVESYTVLERTAAHFLGGLGLTLPQFDVLVTLGDTLGMTCKELGERSLTTKGSLLPILDRLEAKGLTTRAKCAKDARQTIVSLTKEGQRLYETVFPVYVDRMRDHLRMLSAEEQDQLVALLKKLGAAFSMATP